MRIAKGRNVLASLHHREPVRVSDNKKPQRKEAFRENSFYDLSYTELKCN
jgi:hypothetical protein